MSKLLETVLLKVLQRAGFIDASAMLEGADLMIAGVRYAESNAKITDQILPVEAVRLMPSKFGPETRDQFLYQQIDRSDICKEIYMASHRNERWCRVWVSPKSLEVIQEFKDKGYIVEGDIFNNHMKRHEFIIRW